MMGGRLKPLRLGGIIDKNQSGWNGATVVVGDELFAELSNEVGCVGRIQPDGAMPLEGQPILFRSVESFGFDDLIGRQSRSGIEINSLENVTCGFNVDGG